MATQEYDIELTGYVGGEDFNIQRVNEILEKRKGSRCSVLIDSLGGSVATAISIAEAFKTHGDVNVHFRGMNASAATIASLGAKHISMSSSAMYLVHKCSNFVFMFSSMNADQLRSVIDDLNKNIADLDKIDINLACMYADRCKRQKDALLALMKDGGWLSAKEALEFGFVDEIINDNSSIVKIDSKLAADMSNAGIPVPHVSGDSFIDKISSLFGNIFGKKADFDFSKIEELIGKSMTAGATASVSVDALNAIEEKFNNFNSEIQALKTRIEEMQNTIETLKAEPAATSPSVIAEPTKNAEDDFLALWNKVSKNFGKY